jgi:ubiquinone biosynthesis protein
MLGRFLARHAGPGITPDVTMFTDLFRIVSEHGLAVPPEIAAVFRALATMEGTLTQLAPGFDIVAEARRFAGEQLTAQFSPDVLRKTAADELIALLPTLRRLTRRSDRIGGALEAGRLSVNVRLLADPADRRYLTGLLHQVILVALAATSGIMAVLMLGLHGGPAITTTVTLYAFFGYCLLVIAAILALRVLVLVFRRTSDDAPRQLARDGEEAANDKEPCGAQRRSKRWLSSVPARWPARRFWSPAAPAGSARPPPPA